MSHEYMGLTFDGAAIARVAQEIGRQKAAKRDLIYPISKLSFSDDGALVFAASDKTFEVDGRLYLTWQDAEKAADDANKADRPSQIIPRGPQGVMPLNGTASSQLLTRLNVPGRFASYLRGQGYGDTLGNLLRDLMGKDKESKVLVRTLDSRVRAVLSDKYRILDNADLFFCAMERFKEVGAQPWKARLWEDGFELFATAPHIAAEVSTDRTFDPGDGWQSRWYGKSGDVHNAAVRINNSETGEGGLNVRLAILRRVCANFCVWGEGVSTIHAGKRQKNEGLLVSDETRELESKVIWSKCRDAISTAFNAEKFQAYIDSLNNATKDVVAKPEDAVDNVVREYAITEDRKSEILAELLGSGDRSRFGLIQAVTATAHKSDAGGRAAEASKLEEIGGELATMGSKRFAELIGA